MSVGEKHSLALQRWSAAQLPGLQRVPWLAPLAPGGERAGERCGSRAAAAAAAAAAEEEEAYRRAADSLATPRGGGELDSEPSALSGLDSQATSPDRCAAHIVSSEGGRRPALSNTSCSVRCGAGWRIEFQQFVPAKATPMVLLLQLPALQLQRARLASAACLAAAPAGPAGRRPRRARCRGGSVSRRPSACPPCSACARRRWPASWWTHAPHCRWEGPGAAYPLLSLAGLGFQAYCPGLCQRSCQLLLAAELPAARCPCLAQLA